MKNILLIAFLAFSVDVLGQAGLFQDAKGESALKVFGNSVSLSTKDQSINFAVGNYYRELHPTTTADLFRRWAVSLELKANEGLANIKSDNTYLLDGSLGAYHGWKRVSGAAATGPAFALERFISATVGTDRNKLFNATLAPKEMIYNNGQFVYKFEIGQYGYTGNLLYGISASFKQQTNVGDLTTKTVNFLDYASANDSTLVYRQNQAYDVNEFIHAQHVLSVNTDLALLINRVQATGPGNALPVFLAFNFRYQYVEHENGQFNPGLGFYLGRRGAPRTIIGGFNVQFLDAFNAKNEKTSSWDRATINFVVGFKIS